MFPQPLSSRGIFYSSMALCTATLLLLLSGCSLDPIETDRKLVLGICADNPPFTFEESGVYTGFEVELACEVAKHLGYELEIKDIEFGSLIAAVKSGVVDFASASFGESEERKKSVDFSCPFYEGKLSILGSKKYTNISELSGKCIGVQLGSTWEQILQNLQTNGLDIKLESIGKVNQLVEHLKLGHVQALVIDPVVAQQFAQRSQSFIFSQLEGSGEGICMVFPKKSDLTQQVTTALNKMKDSGELDRLKQRWLAQTQNFASSSS